MLTSEKRTTFNSIMSGYTNNPHFDTFASSEDIFEIPLRCPSCNRAIDEWNDSGWPPDDLDALAATDFESDYFGANPFIDLPEFADDFGLPFDPIAITEEDLRFLRDFILSSATYVEQLESLVCESSDDFWEGREHAYRLITNILLGYYEYEMEE
ncbi:MAG TPA: hypothetical protein VGM92_12955 [Candidatus Kapabacteria bacterium]|jgi:hypothetical protein